MYDAALILIVIFEIFQIVFMKSPYMKVEHTLEIV